MSLTPPTRVPLLASFATGTWITDRPSGNGDTDWFRFTLKAGHRMVLTAGDLPVNARLDLYSSCSVRLATVDANTDARYEELTRNWSPPAPIG